MMKSRKQMIDWIINRRKNVELEKDAVERKMSYLLKLANANNVVIVNNECYKRYQKQLNDLSSELYALNNHLESIENGTLIFPE